MQAATFSETGSLSIQVASRNLRICINPEHDLARVLLFQKSTSKLSLLNALNKQRQ